jgi:hypothetical protein
MMPPKQAFLTLVRKKIKFQCGYIKYKTSQNEDLKPQMKEALTQHNDSHPGIPE